ncbi:MAG: hypothetical protein V5A43_06765 [Haloarculaceae archaeon]
MSEDADDEPTVPITCPDCGTETRIAVDDVANSLAQHNDRLHDGEAVAQVDPDVADQLADLVAADMGLLEE